VAGALLPAGLVGARPHPAPERRRRKGTGRIGLRFHASSRIRQGTNLSLSVGRYAIRLRTRVCVAW
jgi:hypothetical protein